MSVLLDATIAGEFSNSYVDITYADQFFEADSDTARNDAWSALGDDQKQRLLVQATYAIEAFRFTYNSYYRDQNYEYDSRSQKVIRISVDHDPVRYDASQNLQFPRNFDINLNTGLPYIPEPIKMAQCEQALYTVTFDNSSIVKVTGGIKSEEVEIAGQIRRAVTYQDAASITATGTSVVSGISPIVFQYLSSFIARSSKARRA
jgi:hypothetical protein